MSKMITDIMPLKGSHMSEVRMSCQIINESRRFNFGRFAIIMNDGDGPNSFLNRNR